MEWQCDRAAATNDEGRRKRVDLILGKLAQEHKGSEVRSIQSPREYRTELGMEILLVRHEYTHCDELRR